MNHPNCTRKLIPLSNIGPDDVGIPRSGLTCVGMGPSAISEFDMTWGLVDPPVVRESLDCRSARTAGESEHRGVI